MLRTLRIRALENAVYTPAYNRMTFDISPDEMSTDLSESYLALKTIIVNQQGLPYNRDEINKFNAQGVQFCFGDGLGQAYSPACMIKVARLFRKDSQMTILEEVQYSNVLSQSLYQLANNFETQASESLLTMGASAGLLSSSIGSATSSYFGAPASLTDPSVQVNIKLSDLFGVCRSSNFFLSQTNGLQIVLELEDSKPLIVQNVPVELTAPLPTSFSTTSTSPAAVPYPGFTDNYATNRLSIRCEGQNEYAQSNEFASTEDLIPVPEGYLFRSNYVDHIFTPVGFTTDIAQVGKNYSIADLGTLTPAQWQAMGLTLIPQGPVISTSVAVVGYKYIIPTGKTNLLTLAQWFEFGAYNEGASASTSTIVGGTFYKVLTPGTLTLVQWSDVGWDGDVEPVAGDGFLAVISGGGAVAGGQVSVITLPDENTGYECLAQVAGGQVALAAHLPSIGSKFTCIAAGPNDSGVLNLLDSNFSVVGAPGATSRIISIASAYPWAVADMTALGIEEGASMRLTFKITKSGTTPRFFQWISLISDTTAAVQGNGGVTTTLATIQLRDNILLPDYSATPLVGAQVSLEYFEILPNSVQFLLPTTGGVLKAGLEANTMAGVLPATIVDLQYAGVLSGGTSAQITAGTIRELSGTNTFFTLSLGVASNGNAGDAVVGIYPDEYENADIPTMRKLYSNQTKRMPTQGTLCRIIKATFQATGEPANSWTLFFETLGMENDNSLQFMNLLTTPTAGIYAGGLPKREPAEAVYVNMFNSKLPKPVPAQDMVVGQWYGIKDLGTASAAQWIACGATAVAPAVDDSFLCVAPMAAGPADTLVVWLHANKSLASYVTTSFQITKAEIVLVQKEKDPALPMSMVYPTMKCEAFTIEGTQLPEYNRQFIVSEPNCYSIVLCNPQYSGASESLISRARGIGEYRWSVQNIDDTNRNLVVGTNTSAYPASLHLDKLLDTLRNEVVLQKSLSGISGVSRSVFPVTIFPLKVYTASDAENHFLNPLRGFTIQFAGYADTTHENYVEPGSAFLFKFMFKSL